jgi:hypothetical protein
MWISSSNFLQEVGGQSKLVRGKGKFMCKALDYDWIYCVFCLTLFWAPFQKRACPLWWKFPFFNITPIYKKINKGHRKEKKRKEKKSEQGLYKLQLQAGRYQVQYCMVGKVGLLVRVCRVQRDRHQCFFILGISLW